MPYELPQNQRKNHGKEPDKSKALQQDSELAFYQIEQCLTDLNFVEAEKLAKALLIRVEAECAPSDPLRRRVLVEFSNASRLVEENDAADEALIKAIQLAALHGHGDEGEGSLNDLRMKRAELMNELGRADEALALTAAVLEESGTDEPQRVASCIGMAQAYMAAGNAREYGVFMQIAYAAARNVKPDSVETLIDVFIEGGEKEVREGRFEGAARLYQSAVELMIASPHKDWQRIAGLEMYIAEQEERAGNFGRADSIRARVLREAGSKLEDDDEFLMDVREALALGMVNHSGGNFEHAEKLLVDNVIVARNVSDSNVLIKALVSLASAHSSRGMYREAVQELREAHQQLNELYDEIDPDVRIQVLREFATLLAECGAREEAEMLFRAAVEEARQIPGPQSIVAEVALSASLASIIGADQPEEARGLIQRCYDLLDELPPNCEPVSRRDLKLILLSIEGDEAEANTLEGNATSRLAELQRQYGESFATVQAHLMLQRANAFMKDWDLERAREELESVKELLEKRAHTHTSLFAMVLSTLADTLSPDDWRASEYRQQAEKILERAQEAMKPLDSEDEEDFGDQ